MQAIEELEHEHRIIELVLNALDDMAQQVEQGQPLDRAKAARALEVLTQFADKCHHGKEERHLFVQLHEAGFPRDTGPVAVMLSEHGQGRQHLRAMAEALQAAPADTPNPEGVFAEHARAYAALLRSHIRREEGVLFPMAARTLPPDADARLMEAFEQVEREEVGPGEHERYHALAHELGQGHRDAA